MTGRIALFLTTASVNAVVMTTLTMVNLNAILVDLQGNVEPRRIFHEQYWTLLFSPYHSMDALTVLVYLR
jgi:hypothetical protein